MISQKGRKGNYEKMAVVEKGNIELIFYVHLCQGYMCKCMQDMKFLWSNLWKGGLSTDDKADDNNDDENTQQVIHDCLVSLVFMPNEPITRQ